MNLTSLHVERAVIGACLLRPGSMDQAQALGLTEQAFSDGGLRLVWAAAREIVAEGGQADELSVCTRLEQAGTLGQAGGFPAVSALTAEASLESTTGQAVRSLLDLQLRRGLIEAGTVARRAATDGALSASEALGQAQGALASLEDGQPATTEYTMGEAVSLAYEEAREASQADAPPGMPIRLVDLQSRLGGIRPGRLYILAARPRMGKTALAGELSEHVAAQGRWVRYQSLEMGAAELGQRRLARQARVSVERLERGTLRAGDYQPLLQAVEADERLPYIVDDQSGITLSTISARARAQKRRQGLDLLVVDYLQLLRPEDTRASREQQVSAMARGLKVLAKDLNCAVLALAQLNRKCESREDKRPVLSDLRESGGIEQDADVVMMLHRESVYQPESRLWDGLAEVIVRKARQGTEGTARVAWRGELQRFEDLAADEWPSVGGE